jgi:hypothetical protein
MAVRKFQNIIVPLQVFQQPSAERNNPSIETVKIFT